MSEAKIFDFTRGLACSLFVLLFALLEPSYASQTFCGHVYSASPVFSDISALDAPVGKLRIGSYNVENLFEHVGKFPRINATDFAAASKPKETKPEHKVMQIRKIIDSNNMDIIFIQEVESRLALEQLAKSPPLRGKYRAYWMSGNDARIGIGVLVRNTLPLYVQMRSNSERTAFDRVEGRDIPVFSRDAPVMIFREAPDTSAKLVVVGVHSKSQRDRNDDPLSSKLRTLQNETVADIVKDLQTEFGKDTHLIVTGDFNAHTRENPEMRSLLNKLQSAFDYAAESTPVSLRYTHTYHPKDGPASRSQLDDFLVSPSLKGLITLARVIMYTDSKGKPQDFAKTYDERSEQPSDHMPIMMELDFSR